MPKSIKINSWPTCLDNISWSDDNLIAVATGPTVHILTPTFDNTSRDGDQWSRVTLEPNKVDEGQRPHQDTLPWTTFSVGEELSEQHVCRAEWSPPGLAKFRRCVLTVLTSTHILSLWACVGRPDREPDWQRVLIVNPILKSFVADQVNGETKTKKGSESTDDVRLSRIRSFAWCPAVRLPSRNDTTAGDSAWGRHMLAVSNDCGQVIILEIKSPHHRIRPSSDIIWQAQVLYCLDPPDNLGRSALLSCLPTTYKEPPPRVDQIAWSPWIRDDAHGRTFSKLAVTVTGKLYHTQVHITIPQDSIVLQVDPYELLSPAETTVAGPIKWSHIEASSSKLHLAACSRGILQCFTFRVPDTNLFDSTSRRISGRWDEVSSLSFGVDADGNTVIHYALFLTELKAEHVTIRLPLDEKESGVASPWQRDIKGEQALFSASEDLVGFVSARTYGISISPLADFVASCVSFHPSDGLEYAIKRAQWSYLNVTRQLPVNIDQLFPFVKAWNHAQGTSAETVLFSLQSFHDSTVSATQTDEGKVIKQVAKAISAYPLPATHATECAAQGRSDISNPIMELRRLMLVDEEADIWRAERLFRLAQRDRDTTAVPHVDIVQRLVAGTRNMSRSLSNWDPLSRAMLRNHRLVSSKLAERTGKASHDVEMADTTESEVCTICRGDMPFEALKWARCANGHQSIRCGLSFLAIQVPGEAKSCNLCNIQYLNEHEVSAFDYQPTADATQGDDTTKPRLSLARILFAACDVCIYCGGRYAV